MISLIIPPRDQIARVNKMLADEFGTASNIKSRVNRLSVLGAITSVQQRLKLYNKGKRFSLLSKHISCVLLEVEVTQSLILQFLQMVLLYTVVPS